MMHILTCLLALFFSLSSPAMEANAVFCHSSLAAEGTMALTRGTRVGIRIRAADFTADEQSLIRARYEVANARIGTGAEVARVGDQVPYSYYKSQRFVRDTLFPDRPVSSVRIPDGYQVDEFVSRQVGGRQVSANQSLLLQRINSALGPLEQNALSNLPKGTLIQGWDVEFY